MKKRILSLLLAAVLALSLAPAASAARLPFTDVPQGIWYYNDVAAAYESGLITGTSATTYSPGKEITYAEVVKLAACIYQKTYEGAVTLSAGTPWYQSFVDYAKEKGIISRDYPWTQNATRAGYMEIFSDALKDAELMPQNNVPDNTIPDVAMQDAGAAAIYRLYRAGILTGSDAAHSCKPDTMITRGEVAAILTRMMQKEKRLSFSTSDELSIAAQPADALVALEETAVFSVTVTGGKAPYTYQWYINTEGREFPVTLTASQTLANGGAELRVRATHRIDKGMVHYRCVITDSAGKSVSSDIACMDVVEDTVGLRFSRQPQAAQTRKGVATEMTAPITGGKAPYRYTWQINGSSGDRSEWGQFEEVFRPCPDGKMNSAWISCCVSDDYWNVIYSDLVLLTVTNPDVPISFPIQPQDAAPARDGSVTFTIKPSGGRAPYKYEWHRVIEKHGDIAIGGGWGSEQFHVGEFSDTLTLLDDYFIDETICVYCLVTDADGNSAVTRLAYILDGTAAAEPLRISKQPADARVAVGADAVFMVEATGGKAPYQYEWHSVLENNDFPVVYGNGGSELHVTPQGRIFENMQRYYCVVTDSAGQRAVSREAYLNTIDDSLRFTMQPSDAKGRHGVTNEFTVEVSGGTEPYAYAWTFNGDDVGDDVGDDSWCWDKRTFRPNTGGEISSAYVQCGVSDDDLQFINSIPVMLTIENPSNPITFLKQPQNAWASSDRSITFDVTPTGGTGIYYYRWHFFGELWRDLLVEKFTGWFSVNQDTGRLTLTEPGYDYYNVIGFYCEVIDTHGNTAVSRIALLQ